MDELISKLKKLVSTSDQIVAFTGAGFSAESGISTFRGAGGLWSKSYMLAVMTSGAMAQGIVAGRNAAKEPVS